MYISAPKTCVFQRKSVILRAKLAFNALPLALGQGARNNQHNDNAPGSAKEKSKKRQEAMYRNDHDSWRSGAEHEPLFSRTVKAGKRVYYIDVKRDRRDEYYLSLTESKRVQEGSETERPVFEKHKIFLYREDILKFLTALTDAAQYVDSQRSLVEDARPNYERPAYSQPATPAVEDENGKMGFDADFNIEF